MTVVAGVWVKDLTGSDADAALVAACIYAPSLLALPLGLLVDRVGRRDLLVAGNVAMAVALMPLLAVDHDRAWILFAVMFVYGIALVVIGAAETAWFSELFEPPERARINGLRLSIQEGAKIVAPLVGTGIFVAAGGSAVAAVDAGTFVLAALVATRLPGAPRIRDHAHPWDELTAGVRHVFGTPRLRTLVVATSAAVATSGFVFGGQFSLADALDRKPSFVGVFATLLGAGSLVAGIAGGRLLPRLGYEGLARAAMLNMAVAYGLILTGWLPAALLAFAVLGFALPWMVIAAVTAQQDLAPDRLQGRVATATSMVIFGPLPVLQAVGALVVHLGDFRAVYGPGAAVALLLALRVS